MAYNDKIINPSVVNPLKNARDANALQKHNGSDVLAISYKFNQIKVKFLYPLPRSKSLMTSLALFSCIILNPKR